MWWPMKALHLRIRESDGWQLAELAAGECVRGKVGPFDVLRFPCFVSICCA